MSFKTDLQCLIECLKYHHDDPEKGKDTLLTIASLCSGSNEAQNFLRTSGGLSFVVNLLSTTRDDGIKVAALYALGCAIEKNVFSQTRLCTEAMFKFLYCQLSSIQPTFKIKRTTTYLLMCLVTNNGTGQTLVRKTHCMDSLLQLFRKFPGIQQPYSQGDLSSYDGIQEASPELWMDVTSTLCGCVNNPHNDENQLECASAIPAALFIMTHTEHHHVIQLLCSFISLLTADNSVNQDRLHMLGGLDVIITKLTSIVGVISTDPDKETILSASSIISMLGSATADNDSNLQALSKLKVVPLLLELLAVDVIDQEIRLKIIITLGCLVGANEESQKQVVDSGGLKLLLNAMLTSQDEECVRAATLVLHSCISAVPPPEADVLADVDAHQSVSHQGDPNDAAQELSMLINNQASIDPNDALRAKIIVLQAKLDEERQRRKSVENENASLQLSDADRESCDDSDQEEGADDPHTVEQQRHHPKPPASTKPQSQEEDQMAAPSVAYSVQSSSAVIQLQERMNALEQKLQNLTDIKHQTDSSFSSETSSESKVDSVQTKPLFGVTLKTNVRHCGKSLETATSSSGNIYQEKIRPAVRDAEPKQFKVPTRPLKKCRPLHQVHGSVNATSRGTVSKRHGHHQDQDADTGAKKAPKFGDHSNDIDNLANHMQSCKKGAHHAPCSPVISRYCRPASQSNVMENHGGKPSHSHVNRAEALDRVNQEKQPTFSSHTVPAQRDHKNMHARKKHDAHVQRVCGEISDTASIADSVFSSLDALLSRPIRPAANIHHEQHPVASRSHVQTPSQKSHRSRCQSVVRPDADCQANVYDFVDIEQGPESEAHFSCSSNYRTRFGHSVKQINKKEQEINSKSCETIFVKRDRQITDDLAAKLRSIPKVILKRTPIITKNLKMFTFEANHKISHSEYNDNIVSQADRESSSKLDYHGNATTISSAGPGDPGSRTLHHRPSSSKAKGKSKKCYYVRYVRGKIQCSKLYGSRLHNISGSSHCSTRRSSGDSRTCLAFEPDWTCPGCTPPTDSPLLDSHTLVPSLRRAAANLCKNHTKLLHAITYYSSRKRKRLGI